MRNGIIVDRYGTKIYYKDDVFHREDGPAVIHLDGAMSYWIDGKRHRKDGPAVIYPTGTLEYWIDGKRLDVYHTRFGCFEPNSREEALERLDSKERPYCRELYLADIDAKWPVKEN